MRWIPVRFQLSIWLAVVAALAYLCRTSISVAEKTIRADLDLTEDMMGFILGPAFFWSYALAQIPGGWSGQRFGSRRMLPILSVAFSAATAVVGFAQGAASILAGRIINGMAQAGLFPCSALSISRWFPQIERALASGILGAAMSTGAAVGAALTGELLKILNWRIIFCLYAVPGVVWAVGFHRWFRETPAEHPGVDQAEAGRIAGRKTSARASATALATDRKQSGRHAVPDGAGSEASLSDPGTTEGLETRIPLTPLEQPPIPWYRLISSLALWQICGQQFFRAAGQAFFASWFATYLQETRGVTTAESGWLLTIPLICTVAASLTGGVVSDAVFRKTGNLTLARSGLAAFCLAVCALLVWCAFFVEDAVVATIVIGAGAFFGGVAGPCAYASTMDIGGRNVAPVFSTMNMIGNFGAGLLPVVAPQFRKWVAETPWVLDLAGGNSWNAVLILFGSMYFLAALCWATLRVREGSLDA
ncbi:MAG: MFS transporter [Planctomycetaceae bacterium]|jgi:MFS family permease